MKDDDKTERVKAAIQEGAKRHRESLRLLRYESAKQRVFSVHAELFEKLSK